MDLSPGRTFLESLFFPPLPERLKVGLLFSHTGNSIFLSGQDDGAVTVASQLAYEAQDAADLVYGFLNDHETILLSEQFVRVLEKLLGDETPRPRAK